ncbi:hypothetical protein K439DRAFT_1541868 [Ramaria rubella]|nr:hypothetical protein K439DRAFT_1541868 [Ramaria rubella]
MFTSLMFWWQVVGSLCGGGDLKGGSIVITLRICVSDRWGVRQDPLHPFGFDWSLWFFVKCPPTDPVLVVLLCLQVPVTLAKLHYLRRT